MRVGVITGCLMAVASVAWADPGGPAPTEADAGRQGCPCAARAPAESSPGTGQATAPSGSCCEACEAALRAVEQIRAEPWARLQDPFTFAFRNGATLRLFGKLELVGYYDTTTPAISDWLAWVEPKGSYNGDEDSFSMSVRASPVGMHFTVPRVAGSMALNARVEVDFVGGFVTGGSSAYSPLMRLKQAWVSLDSPHVTILAGQHFGVFGPLFPDTANWIALGTSGNPWIRLPQVRLTLRAAGLQLDLSANRPMGSNEVLTDTVNDHVSDGEWSNMPFLMGRIGGSHDLGRGVSLAWGASGVYGREKVRRVVDPATGKVLARTDAGEWHSRVVPIWMANLDLKLTSAYVDVMGEFFAGANVNSFFAGVLQGVSITASPATETTPVDFQVRSIRTMGGWGQVTGKPFQDLRIYVGAGIDHPDSRDLLPNPKAPPRTWNLQAYGAAHYAIGGAWRVGAEVSYTRTAYLDDAVTNGNLRVVARTSWSF